MWRSECFSAPRKTNFEMRSNRLCSVLLVEGQACVVLALPRYGSGPLSSTVKHFSEFFGHVDLRPRAPSCTTRTRSRNQAERLFHARTSTRDRFGRWHSLVRQPVASTWPLPYSPGSHRFRCNTSTQDHPGPERSLGRRRHGTKLLPVNNP